MKNSLNFQIKTFLLNLLSSKAPGLRLRGHLLTACNVAPTAKSKMAARGPKLADGYVSRLLDTANRFCLKSLLFEQPF